MTKIIKTTFKLRRGHTEAWEVNNPTLEYGEPGFDVDKNILKIGDGILSWNDLVPVNEDSEEFQALVKRVEKLEEGGGYYTLPIASGTVLGGVKSNDGENMVSVDEEGNMEVNSLNIKKLVQTEGDVLVLNGGSSLEE